MRVLVTGGAGYIGSVIAAMLLESGHRVIVLDDCSSGHADAVPRGARLVRATVREAAASTLAAGAEGFDAVIHLAAKALVGESMAKPRLYWDKNLGESLALLEAMRATGTGRIVFSSSAATYGEPERVPILETDPTRPSNPYGASKLAVDVALAEFASLSGIGSVSLRYFNVAGAYGRLGERHAPETHVIPNALRVALGRGAAMSVFGADYPTADGTCVRDYVHVADLAAAHLLALDAVVPGTWQVFNLGSSSGYSVREVIEACRIVTGHPIPVREAPRRPGDPGVLVASSAKIAGALRWKPERDLMTMVQDAWRFARDE